MSDDLNGLDDLEMGDLWRQAKERTPRSDDPDPRRSPRSRVVAGVVAVVIAVAAFAFVRSGFREVDPVVAGGPDPSIVCPSSSHLDPAYVDLAGMEVTTDSLDQPGYARDQITLLPADVVDAFFMNPEAQLSDAPQDGWRAIIEQDRRVVLAAPMPDRLSWYYADFERDGTDWTLRGWGNSVPIATSAQRGAGLHLEWRGDVTYDRRSFDARIWLVNDRPDTWSDDRGEYWAIVHLFDPSSGQEVRLAPAAIAGVGRSYRLMPGEAVELPLALGDASSVEDGRYDAVACVPDLALVSPVGSVTVGDPPASPEETQTPTSTPTDGGEGVTPTPSVSPASDVDRMGIYEAMLRKLVGTSESNGSKPIYVRSDLCSYLSGNGSCRDRLTSEEQQQLTYRLSDLGSVSFVEDGGFPVDGPGIYLLGPILETPDGLRVEGGSVCGGLCGSGATYIVVATDTGYEVAGKDRSYGTWIS